METEENDDHGIAAKKRERRKEKKRFRRVPNPVRLSRESPDLEHRRALSQPPCDSALACIDYGFLFENYYRRLRFCFSEVRYFSPRFQIATLGGEQRKLISKIGGVPWGLPDGNWPHCCGRPQKLLAQLRHEPPMLDLGFPGAVLHLFQCLECCGIDECGRDALVIDGSHLGNGLVRVPEYDHLPDLGRALIGEFWITGWDEHEDGIPAARLAEFFVEKELWALQDEFPNIDWFDPRGRTKFGGSPRWTGNGPLAFPPPPFEFLFQLDNDLYLDGAPPSPNEAGCVITEYEEGKPVEQVHAWPDPGVWLINAPWGIMYERSANYHYAEFTNLGSDGTAYVFIDRTRQPHEVKWLWNR